MLSSFSTDPGLRSYDADVNGARRADLVGAAGYRGRYPLPDPVGQRQPPRITPHPATSREVRAPISERSLAILSGRAGSSYRERSTTEQGSGQALETAAPRPPSRAVVEPAPATYYRGLRASVRRWATIRAVLPGLGRKTRAFRRRCQWDTIQLGCHSLADRCLVPGCRRLGPDPSPRPRTRSSFLGHYWAVAVPPRRSSTLHRNRGPAAKPRPGRAGAPGAPSLSPLFGVLGFFQYLRTHRHQLGVGRWYWRETGSRPAEGTWAPGEEAGGQPLVRTGRSLCVRTQCDCAASSPAIRRRCWPPRRRRSRARTCSRRSRRWEAAEGDVGVGGRRLHTRARSGRYTGSPVAEVGRVGRGGGLACTRPRPSVRCWRYRDGAKRQIVGGAATGAPTQRVHSRLPAGGKPMVHELKWSAEGTGPPGARQKPPDAGVDDGLRFEHPGPAGGSRTCMFRGGIKSISD